MFCREFKNDLWLHHGFRGNDLIVWSSLVGWLQVQVIADFDMTLTKYLVDGVRGQSKF